jgi:hypothetical protein
MSPQVIAAIIAAGVGLLTVGRADFGGPPHNQLGHSERRSKREGKHLIGRSRSSAPPPAGGPALNERFATAAPGSWATISRRRSGLAGVYAVAALAEALS